MACFSRNEGMKASFEIDKILKDEKSFFKNKTQVLLLGAGESGKSTIFKQLKILQDNGKWDIDTLKDFRNTVFINLTSQLHVLLDAVQKSGIEIEPANKERADRIMARNHHTDDWSVEIGEDCVHLWSDKAVKKIFEKRDKEFQLNDSAEYFFNNLQRIIQPDYIPQPQDALRARVMTKGIVEADLYFDSIHMKVIDVGGQRSQRRKWIHCFDNVSAVIFVAALSEYDQFLREEENVNRMDESLSLFSEICNSQWFTKAPILLFLNKKDIFIEKLKRIPFKTYDPRYKGEDTFEAVSGFIQKKYENVRKDPLKHIYTHFTIAVDTQNIKFVFDAVKSIILDSVMDTII
ncbi:gpaF, alpha subunit of heterotrimeric G-protein [Dictyostelium purpureum]|uniref:GpaF, alpha subunit of heterotrimeric G-protein n=1 Tax=Dictyostelium purpureum TaxID=5786 RepID=F0ZB60_DICPU|nr:gpaF, alpha subunit of heterotrimeric G-protein [Dictyostelium purpureum]EGC38864.1 gpaF, alpha subunit of heterotrimeric G-protein [Dictyostelium purpureum]|eukprot:XP_003284658.1 gpaF, alpha subunit of heterotrimeric G-protein [Dictyostelium purpureum]